MMCFKATKNACALQHKNINMYYYDANLHFLNSLLEFSIVNTRLQLLQLCTSSMEIMNTLINQKRKFIHRARNVLKGYIGLKQLTIKPISCIGLR